MQTTPHQAAASFPIRLPFVPGRDPATTVMGLVDQLYYRDGRAFEERGNVSDAMWNTKASRVLGITRQGSCGNGVCEIGETCGWFVEKSVVPGAASDAEWAVHSRINSYNNFRHSVELATEAAELGRRLPGPIAQARATQCCPADCPIELKPCPAPPGSSEPCGGRGRCLPQAGQCDCFPGRGWTGAACGECAEGVLPVARGVPAKTPGAAPAAAEGADDIYFPAPARRRGRESHLGDARARARGRRRRRRRALLRGERRGRDREVRRGTQGGEARDPQVARRRKNRVLRRVFSRQRRLFLLRRRGRVRKSHRAGTKTTRRRAGNRSGETVPGPLRARGAARVRTRRVRVRTRRAFAPHRRLADFDFDREGTLTLPAPRDDATDLRLAEASRRSYASGEPDARRPRPGRRGSRGGTRGGTRRFVDPAAPDPPALPSAGRAWTDPAPALTDPNAERLRLPDAVLTAAERLLRAESSPRSSLRRGSRGDDDAGADLLGLPSERGGAATKSGAPVPGPGASTWRGTSRRGVFRRAEAYSWRRARGRRRRWRSRWRSAMRRPTRGGGRGEGCWCAGPPPRGGGARSGRDGSVGGVRLVFCRGGTPRSRRSG